MRNNALVMSPWRQSIWVSHEIGIIIPPALALVSNQLQGPRPGRGGGVKSTAGTPSRQGEVLQLSLLVPGFLAPLVGLVVWGPLDAQELSCLVALHFVCLEKSNQRGPPGSCECQGQDHTHTRFIQQLATTFSLSTHQCQPVCQCQGAGRGAAES